MAGLRDGSPEPTPRHMGVLLAPPPLLALGRGLKRVDLLRLAALDRAGRFPLPFPFRRALVNAGLLPVDRAALPAGGIGVSAGGQVRCFVLGMHSLRPTPMTLATSALARTLPLCFFLGPFRRRERCEAPSVTDDCCVLKLVFWLGRDGATVPSSASLAVVARGRAADPLGGGGVTIDPIDASSALPPTSGSDGQCICCPRRRAEYPMVSCDGRVVLTLNVSSVHNR
mmetsp:Transcript_20939/g.60049  ORF Transcript_20939/g.60049 Transcript_20939/m.60049 type:complete len:227 (+) Transcript_20939:913-1593(+)